MKQRLISLLLALALLAALPTVAAAAEYSDLEGHWAEPYITALSDLGYITGYTDGTVQPERHITACEAIALLSRFYPVDETTAALIHEKYGDFVSTNIDPTLKWAYDEIETCLAAGILSQNEIRNLRLTVPVDKELLSVLLVRALQLTDKAAALMDDGVELTFDDADDIAAAYRGHIAVLVNNKIVEGNTRNQFTPHAEVTRGVVAAMVVRGLDYVESLGNQLTIPGYEKPAGHSGVVTGVSGSTVTFRDTNGVSRSYPVADSAAITVSGQTAALSGVVPGCYLTVQVGSGAITSLSARNEQGISWVQGVVSEYGKTSSGYSMAVRDLDTGKTTRFSVASNAAGITVNGIQKKADDLKLGMFVTITRSGEAFSAIAAVGGSYALSGTVAALTYGTPALLELHAEDGGIFRFSVDLADPPVITRGDAQVSIERLSVGDEVDLTVENCALTKIAAKASSAAIEGILTSAISTTAGTTWLITDSKNETYSLSVDPAASAYQSGKAILLSAIQVGDSVSVTTDGNVITEIQLRSTGGNNANKLTGTVLVVDTKTRVVTVLTTANRLVYVAAGETGSIINAANGRSVALSSIEVNSQLVAYGDYKDASNFNAKSIVLES